MPNGEIPFVSGGRCPPRVIYDEHGNPQHVPIPDYPYRVCIQHVINDLFEIEKWIKGLRLTLEDLPDKCKEGCCVTITPKCDDAGGGSGSGGSESA